MWPSIYERHWLDGKETSEAAVVTVLQPERCDTAKRLMPPQKMAIELLKPL